MKHGIYVLSLIILASQIPTAQLQNSFIRELGPEFKKYIKDLLEDHLIEMQKNSLKDALLTEDPNKEEIIENYKTYVSLCWNSDSNTRNKKNIEECEVLYGNLGARVRSIQHKVLSYVCWVDEAGDDMDGCPNSNRTEHECDLRKADWKRLLKEVKRKHLPWSEMYEICLSANTERFCQGYIQFLLQLINPTMELKDVAKVICVNSGEAGEKCAADANIEFAYEEDEEKVIDNDERDSNNEL